MSDRRPRSALRTQCLQPFPMRGRAVVCAFLSALLLAAGCTTKKQFLSTRYRLEEPLPYRVRLVVDVKARGIKPEAVRQYVADDLRANAISEIVDAEEDLVLRVVLNSLQVSMWNGAASFDGEMFLSDRDGTLLTHHSVAGKTGAHAMAAAGYLGGIATLVDSIKSHVQAMRPKLDSVVKQSRSARRPVLGLDASFTDPDGNMVLSRDEQGKIELGIRNSGDGAAKDVIVSASLNDDLGGKVYIRQPGGLGNIGPRDSRQAAIPIAATGELPRGSVTVNVDCTFKTEWGERRETHASVTINTAPSTGMVRVAFSGIEKRGLPDWLLSTPLEHADYQVKYSGRELQILNLNTGERETKSLSSTPAARAYVERYFSGWDTEAPHIVLSSSGGTVNTNSLKLRVRYTDDRKLDEGVVYVNGRKQDTESFAERTETEREYTIPLQMGDNTVRITLTDWVGKKAEKSVLFTRIRGGTGTYETGPLPEGEAPPSLVVEAAPLDGNNTVAGGREEGIRVTVTNNGKGVAKWVRVVLEGDEYLTRQWGRERNLEDIKPGESKTAVFSLLMPTELERRQATIEVVVKEGRGYSPTVRPSLRFNFVPAEVETLPVEVVEDVDHGIPKGSLRRSDGYAVIVGVQDYQRVSNLKYARKDAETFEHYASDVLGIPKRRTKVLLDGDATVARVKGTIASIPGGKGKPSFLVLYFSGHGSTDPKTKSDEPYLLPYDADRTLGVETYLSVNGLAAQLAEKADTAILIIDACYMGKGKTIEVAGKPIVRVEVSSNEAVVLSSSKETEPSKEYEQAGHSLFSYYLMLGLKGKADVDPEDGWVTLKELMEYTDEHVGEASEWRQTPTSNIEEMGAGSIRLGRWK